MNKFHLAFYVLFYSAFISAQCPGIYENCDEPIVLTSINSLDGFESCLPEYDGASLSAFCDIGVLNNPVYFSFIATTSNFDLNIDLSNCTEIENGGMLLTGLQAAVIDPCNPNICYNDGSLCEASAFSFEVSGLTIGDTYQLILDGCGGSVCDFIINVDIPDPIICANSSAIEPTRLEYPDENPFGPYHPDETVMFCYQVDFTIGAVGDPENNECQWIQGIMPILGCGWDLIDEPISEQPPAGWQWLNENEVDYNVNNPILGKSVSCCGVSILNYQTGALQPGDLLPGGFWFTSPGGAGCANDGDPDTMWGLPGGCGSSQLIDFCFDLKVKSIDEFDCQDLCQYDLSVDMFTFADGETGCWSSMVCVNDIPSIFDAQIDEENMLAMTLYQDNDGDGYGNPLVTIESCVEEFGYTLNNTDCNDNNESINPGATEIPNNSIDENCDGMDLVQGTDIDNDGFFDDVDCNDADANINPDAEEVCDGTDNNCDGQIDEGLNFVIYYQDNDSDGFGNPDEPSESCTPLSGYTLNNTDCNDSDPNINEAAMEIPNNGIDENCDGMDFVSGVDNDNDGYFDNVDCDDADANINPSAIEECDGLDNNCNGQIDEDFQFVNFYIDEDQDGFGTGESFTDCMQAIGTATEDGDCDDTDPDINPDAIEIANNTIDENCDGEFLIIDVDGDGWNSDIDCDDTNAAINPAAIEVDGNGIDEDCDGIDGTSGFHAIDAIEIKIFPNPVSDKLFINTSLLGLEYQMMTSDGVVVKTGLVEESISMDELINGVYFLKVVKPTSGKYVHEMIVKVN